MILLAGVGAGALIRVARWRVLQGVCIAALIAGTAQLARQAERTNFRFYADPRNPYVYAHPVRDVMRLAHRLDEIGRVSPDGYDTVIDVISEEYWPLPWYLRRFRNVGYWSRMPDHVDASVIVTQADWEKRLRAELKRNYHTEYFGLRPTIVLALLVRDDVWADLVNSWEKKGAAAARREK